MASIDIIANMLTLIRNAIKAHFESVDIPASSLVKAIAEILKQEGFIENYRFSEDAKQGSVRVYLRYFHNKSSVITNLKRASRAGRRFYVKKDKIPVIYRGRGMAIISTSKGIVSDKQAREMGLGGEVLCYVW